FATNLAGRVTAGERAVPIAPRQLIVGGPEHIRSVHVERGPRWHIALPAGGELRAATSLFAGTAVAVVVAAPISELWVLGVGGELRLRTPIPRPDRWAIAEDRGVVIAGT